VPCAQPARRREDARSRIHGTSACVGRRVQSRFWKSVGVSAAYPRRGGTRCVNPYPKRNREPLGSCSGPPRAEHEK
jgi:hypothetical protein